MERNWIKFLPYLSKRKVVNGGKILISYGISLLFRRPIVWGVPFFIHVETSTHCNLSCQECPVGLGMLNRPKGNLSLRNFKLLIQALQPYLIYGVLYFQGEPLLNRDLPEMIRVAHKAGVYSMISTNGHLLDNPELAEEIVNSGLGTLVISLDGADAETYQCYRANGDFDRVVEGIKQVVLARRRLHSSTPSLFLQFLVMRNNEHQIQEIKRLGREWGVDRVLLKTVQIYDFDQAENILPQNGRYRRYLKKDGQYELKGKIKNRCFKLWSDVVITWDGRVLPCCFDKQGAFEMGRLPFSTENSAAQLIADTFVSIWKGERYQRFRKRVLTDRRGIAMCQNCTEGVRIYSE